jgi:tetratricopeptide (TPR) repeat protein
MHAAVWNTRYMGARYPYSGDRPLTFFIAYAAPDAAIAERLYDLLVGESSVFLDRRNLRLGDDWDRELAAAQQRAEITLVLVSDHTEDSFYQREEIATAIDMARHGEHRVIPIWLGAARRHSVPYGLRIKQGLDLREPGDMREVARKLLAERTSDAASFADRPLSSGPASNDHDRRDQSINQGSAPVPVAVMRALPRDTAAFAGRTHELTQLVQGAVNATATGRAVVIHAINGMPGVGKTALAVHTAHMLAPRFPDGQLFVRLHAHTPGRRAADPADVLVSLLVAAGVTAQAVPAELDARSAMWRDRLVGKRLLMVLDDAAGHEQVEPLLPAAAGTLALVTSRRRLAALDVAVTLPLDTLPPAEAAELFTRLAARQLNPADAQVTALVRLCGYLPLAIALLAARLRHHPSWSTGDLVTMMAVGQDRLAELQAEDVAVATAFDLSYHDLPEERQRLFRRIGLHAGSELDAKAAAALGEVSVRHAQAHLDGLYNDRLVDEPVRGRYRMHDLIRDYATRLAATEDSVATRRSALTRLFDYYLATATAAALALSPAEQRFRPQDNASAEPGPPITAVAARAWLDTERANLVATVVQAGGDGWTDHCLRLAAVLSRYLETSGNYPDAATVHSHALQAARHAGDGHGEADALDNLGVVCWRQSRYEQAARHLDQALAVFRRLGDRAAEARVLGHLGVVGWRQGRFEQAAGQLERALVLSRRLGDRAAEAAMLSALGLVGQRQGHYPEAARRLERALTIFERIGDRAGAADALNSLGLAYQRQEEWARAVDHHRQGLALFREIGEQEGEADALNHLGLAYQGQGELLRAVDYHRQGLALFREIGSQSGEADALNHLGLAYLRQGDPARAIEQHRRALALFREVGDLPGQVDALNCLGDALRADGSIEQARRLHNDALAVAIDIGDRGELAHAHDGLGEVYRAAGNVDLARDHWTQALALYRDLEVSAAEAVRANLAALD